MSVIVVASDILEVAREIAEKTAQHLGYRCLGREILPEIVAGHQVSQEKLIKALDEAPVFLGMSARTRKRYLAYIQAAVLPRLMEDNAVCYGLAAHFYVMGISHVLKVRILSDQEALARKIAAQTRITQEKALGIVRKRIADRKRWAMAAFHSDGTDPSHYDLVIKLSQIDSARAVDILAETIRDRRFQPMTYSRKRLADVALESRARAILLERFPDVTVESSDGRLLVQTIALKRDKQKRASAIKELVGHLDGVRYVEVRVVNDFFRQAIESFR